jgi:hypothetical protein
VANIMVFVTHAPDIGRRDLHATIAGLTAPDGKRIFMLSRKMQKQVLDAARKVDLFLWIDADKGTCQHVSVNGAPHQAAALELHGLKNDDGFGRSDRHAPHLDAVALELREALRLRVAWRHEEHIAVPLAAPRHLGEIGCELAVVAR